jgi:glycosyltransferase involved in cell wall biosynthesis
VKRFKPLFQLGNAPFIPELMSIKNFDIIHLHYPFYFGGEMVYLLSKLKKMKYVITYQNDVILGGLLNPFVKLHNKTAMRVILGNASKICVLSLDFAQNSNLSQIVKKKFEKIVILPNGVDIVKFNPKINNDSIKMYYKIENKKIILFVGALDKAHYFKGVDYLLKSFAKIQSDDVLLMIIGEGELKKSYVSLAEKLGIISKVIFVGRVPNEELPNYYSAADLVVLPSVCVESFGVVLIEAMACGKPVIASNLPGVKTVVDDGVNGFLTHPKDIDDLTSKMQDLLENQQMRIRFGKTGREKVEKMYSWDKIGKKLEQTYLEIV